MKNLIKENKITIFGIIIGIILATTTVYAATIYYSGSEIVYTPTSGMSSTDVQSALDELYNDYQSYLPLYNKVGSAALTTSAQNLSGAVNEINENTLQYLGGAPNNTSTNFTLPSSGTYLVLTGHNSTMGANTIWIARTGGNTTFCISDNCASRYIEVTVSGTTLTVLSTGGWANVAVIKMP